MRFLALAALAAVLTAAGTADAAKPKKKKTFCEKAAGHNKVLTKSGGVTVYQNSRQEIYGCSNKYRTNNFLAGETRPRPIKLAKGAASHCILLHTTEADGTSIPSLLYADIKKDGSFTKSHEPAGDASVVKLAVSSNCGFAWAESSPSAGKRILLLPKPSATEPIVVATVTTDAELKSIKATAAGKKVKVTWSGGSKTLP